VSNRRSAARYAKALVEVARREGDPRAIEGELAAFASMVAGHERLSRVVASPTIPASKKAALVEALAARAEVGPIVRKLLVLLAGRDRLVLLPDLLDQYRACLLDLEQVVRAEVTSAAPLPDGAAQAIGRAIEQRTGRKVTMTARVDRGLIGGVVARVGSVVYDGSVKRQLEKMKDVLTGTT
jgi:F-type H+-transporting ATPase subunit delta